MNAFKGEVKRRYKGGSPGNEARLSSNKEMAEYRGQVQESLNAAQNNFRNRVFQRRKELGFSQRQLAKLLDVSVNTLQTYETGSLPRGGNLIFVAKALGCSVDWLLGMEGDGTCVNLELLPEEYDKAPGKTSGLGGFKRINHYELPGMEPVIYDALSFSFKWLKDKASDPENVRMIFYPLHGKSDFVMLVDLGVRNVFQGCNYLVNVNGHHSVNRVAVRPGGNYLLSNDNEPNATPYEVPVQEVGIIGRIIWTSQAM